jgi:cysteinyl-tRNA synthetase
MLKLYNTLTKKIEDLRPLKDNQIGLYTCGPTVYNYAHIGNLRTYIFEDLLKRVLEYDGYKVNHAMNITDVGHLVGDGDEGEDKLEVGAKREGKNPLDIAKFYTDKFFQDTDALNIIRPSQVLSATQTIPEQIDIIKILVEKGYAYIGEQAVYFDTSKFADYGKLSGQKLSDKKIAAREDVIIDKDKKHPADFALWFFLKGRYQNHILQWDSPWGKGFPGWHIECSAISRKLLGQPFDIHTGGVDHIGTHHTNEIAQSEAAFGVPLANVWMHGEFLQIDAKRMGKSEGNFITLDTLKEKGFSPLDYRYLCLTAHYRTQLNFTWEGLEGAHNALERLRIFLSSVIPRSASDEESLKFNKGSNDEYQEKFSQAINNDLNIPEALAIVWEIINSPKINGRQKWDYLLKFDKVFGLNLGKQDDVSIPKNIEDLLLGRKAAKDGKNFKKSDELRKQIEDFGYEVMDTPEGQKVKKKLAI